MPAETLRIMKAHRRNINRFTHLHTAPTGYFRIQSHNHIISSRIGLSFSRSWQLKLGATKAEMSQLGMVTELAPGLARRSLSGFPGGSSEDGFRLEGGCFCDGRWMI